MLERFQFQFFWIEDINYVDFSYIKACKNGFSYRGPNQSPGTLIFTNLNMHYIKKLSGKSEFSLSSGSQEDFYLTLPYFGLFVIISPVKRTWSFFSEILNSFHRRVISIQFY
jgi:hypothetical protein